MGIDRKSWLEPRQNAQRLHQSGGKFRREKDEGYLRREVYGDSFS